MKSSVLLLLTLLAFSAHAQLNKDSLKLAKPVLNKSNVPVKVTNYPPKPAGTQVSGTPKTTQSKPGDPQPELTDADYFLAGAVVRISTGNDNKELNNSIANFFVRPRKSNGIWSYNLMNYANEIPVNKTVDLRLDRVISLTSAQNSLKYFKQNGVSVVVAYANKYFCTDAWKINSVTVVLEFKDVNGNPAPGGYAFKTISFPVSACTLGFIAGCNPFWAVYPDDFSGFSDQKSKMVLKTDEYFNPLPAQLFKWREDDVN